jgi:hypothetical protein
MVPLTRELAHQFKDLTPVPGERPLRQSRLNFFQRHLRDHTFGSPYWAKAIIGQTEEERRADGQHTSYTLATCDDSLFPQGISVTVTVYHLDDISELAQLFDLFDNPQSARTNAEKLGIYIADYAELLPLDRGYLNKLAHGIDYYLRDCIEAGQKDVHVYPQRQQGTYYKEPGNRQFALRLYALCEAKNSWMFNKPGIVAEMYFDCLTHPDIAQQFWREVMTESNPDVEDESRILATALRDYALKQPRVRQDKFRASAQKYFTRYRKTHGASNAGPETAPMAPVPATVPISIQAFLSPEARPESPASL